MKLHAPRREAKRSLMIAFVVILGSGFVVGTTASFTSNTSNRGNTFSSAALTAPQGLTGTAAGTDVNLGWTAGSFGGGTGFGHRVLERSLGVQADPRDGSAAPGACADTDTFGTAVGRTAAATTTLTHSGIGVASSAGSYACYKVDTEYPASPGTAAWFSQNGNPVASVMLGHVVKSVNAVNVLTLGTFEEGDLFTFTFNQAVNIATGPTSTNNPTGKPTTGNDVCVVGADGTITFGRTIYDTDCAASQSYVVGRVSGLTLAPSGEKDNYHAAWTWSDCPVAGQCRQLTATIGKRYRGRKDVTVSATTSSSLTPTAVTGWLTSATGGAALCSDANTATSTCRPVPTGSV